MQTAIQDRDFTLSINWKLRDARRHVVSSLLLFVILILVYMNSFNCSWHFDDYINIVENPGIQIKNLSWQGIENGLHGIAGTAR
ncbi:MAG TPA: hypothetical protein VFG29_06640, partial [Syntrophales bacterium]|nr:hypothetical protein [Syntrophales bacterium]